jgi:molybdopterin-guanine dinucleotide biosynthesis protein A
MTQTTGFILAGGLSRRMGRDKAWMRLDGRSLIERVITQLRPCVDQVCVVANERNVESFRDLDVDACITDLAPCRGPLMGVYTGLMSAQTPLNVFAACDMPQVDAGLIRALLGAWHGGDESLACVGPDEQVYPLPMVCHLSTCRTVGALLDQGRDALKSLFDKSASRLIKLEDPAQHRLFWNINTAADYEQLSHEPAVPFRR